MRELYVSSNKLKQIDDLEDCTDLEILRAMFNQIESVQVLRKLVRLKEVNLTSNWIRIITPFSYIDRLIVLGLDLNRFETLEVLSAPSLANLTRLSISESLINQIDTIGNLLYLNELRAKKCGIKDLFSLSKLIRLVILDLSHNSIRSISRALDNMTSLEELHLDNNLLDSLDGLQNSKSLRVLNITNNRIKTINQIEKFLNLIYLFANNNSLTSLTGIESSTKLFRLEVANNKLTSIEPVKNLVKLRYITADSNSIDTTIHLSKLTLLEYIYFKDNKLKSLEGFKNLRNLRKIKLDGNQIELINHQTPIFSSSSLAVFEINGNKLDSMTNLIQYGGFLNIYSAKENRIKEINCSTFNNMDILTEIYLSSNAINFIEKDCIKDLPKLATLDLGFNSIERISGVIFRNLENLKYVNIDINENWPVSSLCFYIDSIRSVRQVKQIANRDYHTAIFTRSRSKLKCEIRLLFAINNILLNVEFDGDIQEFLQDCQEFGKLWENTHYECI